MDTLPIDKQSNLYGIILEVLDNISKHSKATLVTLKMKKDSFEKFYLIIQDNGIGFDPKKGKGIGLINIKQRTELLKGISNFKKADTGGTIFQLTFPLEE